MRSLVAACVASAALSLVACLEPTQIEMTLRTDVAWQAGRSIAIVVGKPGTTEGAEPSTVYEDAWENGDIGSLVLLPGDERDEPVSVRVVMSTGGRDPSTCTLDDAAGCIFARRRLAFVPHEPLRLPVTLYSACEGVPCSENSTCSALGTCVPADVDPSSCAEGKICDPGAVGGGSSSGGVGSSTSGSGSGGTSDGGSSSSSGGSSSSSSGGGSSGLPPACQGDAFAVASNEMVSWGNLENNGGTISIGDPTSLATDEATDSIRFYRTGIDLEAGACPLQFYVEFTRFDGGPAVRFMHVRRDGDNPITLEDRWNGVEHVLWANGLRVAPWSGVGKVTVVLPLSPEHGPLRVVTEQANTVVNGIDVGAVPAQVDLEFGLSGSPTKVNVARAGYLYAPAPP